MLFLYLNVVHSLSVVQGLVLGACAYKTAAEPVWGGSVEGVQTILT